MDYAFIDQIKLILQTNFGDKAEQLFESSSLLQYLNIKTRSANRSSKARSSYANLYAIYVLVEDYIINNFHVNGEYSHYQGAVFTSLLSRQRQLPFGSKLQNHALNSRVNEEYKRYFPQSEYLPVLRSIQTNRYWINENLLLITVGSEIHNIATSVIKIIDKYIEVKKDAFEAFLRTCQELQALQGQEISQVQNFIKDLLAPNIDARIFEIVSFVILKFYYSNQVIYFGFEQEDLQKDFLRLYKTGRTNANDGGIDFVMQPLGRFFQVTESLDIKKYFLDIDKIERYPLTFVIKSDQATTTILERIRQDALKQYVVEAIIDSYIKAIEEIINIPILLDRFAETVKRGYLPAILEELVKQSQVEFNFAGIIK